MRVLALHAAFSRLRRDEQLGPLWAAGALKHEPRGYDRGVESTLECNAHIPPILKERVISASMRGAGKRHPWPQLLPECWAQHMGLSHRAGEGVVFCPWAMKGERPLTRFMHYAGGRSSWRQGCGVWIFHLYLFRNRVFYARITQRHPPDPR